MIRHLRIFFLLIAMSAISLSFTYEQKQVMYKGYQYNVNDDEFYAFKYTRTYTTSNDGYLTVYKIYNPKNGRIVITVNARHILSEKKIVVEVKNPNGGIFSDVCKEETSYTSASLKPFGFRGATGAFGNRIPNQLMVKFASNKFQNVKVVHVNGTEAGSNNLLFYVLDEEN